MSDQLSQFTGVEPLQLHLELANLLDSSASMAWIALLSLLFYPGVNNSLELSRSCLLH